MADDKKPSAPRKDEPRTQKELNKDLESTFPASDPVAATEPGGGITGPPKRKNSR